VVEHPGGDRDVELAVAERQILDVAEARVDAALPRQVDHPRGEVDRDHLGTGRAADPLRELAPAAADLEHSPRRCFDDRCDGRLARIPAGLPGHLCLDARPKACLVGVLGGDERRVVEADHGSTIGVPGTPRGDDLPPSHALTVAPTSANSPSS